MLTYTFSRREKALLLALAVVLLAVAWFALVYQSTTNEINRLEGRISATQSDIEISSAQVAQMEYMQAVVEQAKAEGATAKPVPSYDNVQPLMAFLDGVMAVTDSYELSFEELDMSDSSYVMRPVKITFKCGSYAVAESLADQLANGPYTCLIDSVSIAESTRSSGLIDSMVGNDYSSVVYSGAIRVVFYEKYPADGSLAPTASGSSSSTSTSR